MRRFCSSRPEGRRMGSAIVLVDMVQRQGEQRLVCQDIDDMRLHSCI